MPVAVDAIGVDDDGVGVVGGLRKTCQAFLACAGVAGAMEREDERSFAGRAVS